MKFFKNWPYLIIGLVVGILALFIMYFLPNFFIIPCPGGPCSQPPSWVETLHSTILLLPGIIVVVLLRMPTDEAWVQEFIKVEIFIIYFIIGTLISWIIGRIINKLKK